MKILKAFKMRIYPNATQRELITNTFGCARFVWNQMLGMQQARYTNNKHARTLNAFAMNIVLTQLKREKTWLKQVDSTALTAVNDDLWDAYQRFFNKKLPNGFPRFKSKRYAQSYTAKCVSNNIKVIDNHRLKLPKLGQMQYRCGHQITGKIKRATIRINSQGQYYASILCECENQTLPKTSKNVGIDLGLKNLAITSDGDTFDVAMIAPKLERKLRVWERKMARRRINAKKEIAWDKHEHSDYYRSLLDFPRYQQARRTVAKIKAKITQKRLDNLHKLTITLVKKYDVIVVEKLNVKGMMQNHNLARAIANSAWAKLVELLKYKCDWYGKQLIVVDPKNTSRICSTCGNKNAHFSELTTNEWLNVREWTCTTCQAHHDRDVNASINILKLGLSQKA